MSRVVRFNSLGGPEVLQIESRQAPVPGDDEVLIQVKAIGLNRADVMFRRGNYLEKQRFPRNWVLRQQERWSPMDRGFRNCSLVMLSKRILF